MGIMDLYRLDGQVAVVTGGGKGIGRAIAIALAEAGADVAVAARSKDDLERVADEIRARGRRALAVPTNVLHMEALETLAARAEEALGPLSIWVNNAGGLPDGKPRYLTRTSEDQWDAQVDLNLKAVWMGAVVAAAHMKERSGVILNTSSRASFGGHLKNGPYAASKAGVNSLTASLALELAPKIRVVAIAPGPVPTENFNDSMGTDTEEKREALREMIRIPLQRYGREDDIAAAALFLVSPAASWITGTCLYVTGGA